MGSKKRLFNSSHRMFFLVVCVVMAIITLAAGVLLTIRSVNELKTVLWNHMASVADLAAELIDGDELKQLTEDDSPLLDPETGARVADGSERYSSIESILLQVKASQKDVNVQYIYITKYEQGHQVFVVDPDVEKPAKYGDEVVYTPSQEKAWAGKTSVDDQPYADEWGLYYSAWSPVMDSTNRVVGLVGIDFEASEITGQLVYSIVIIIGASLLLLALNILIFITYSFNERKHIKQLSSEVANLSDNLKTMFDEIEGVETEEEENESEESISDQDFAKYVHEKTIAMTQRLRKHTAYMMQQANIDFLTKVGNTRAYSAEKGEMQEKIDEGEANFAVAVFDINDLKEINDKFGHENGDIVIKAAADALKKAFAGYNVYRIGGDEFSVILPSVTDKRVDLLFELLAVEIEIVNKTIGNNVVLSMSKGYSMFDPEYDRNFKEVFVRADNNMYAEKDKYHQSMKKSVL
ncbi:MAG: GGDEF domain-containing protein [Clostridiales bacterium]|nr:GGDEF domain-containing protein [Clostridiales bacterium]